MGGARSGPCSGSAREPPRGVATSGWSASLRDRIRPRNATRIRGRRRRYWPRGAPLALAGARGPQACPDLEPRDRIGDGARCCGRHGCPCVRARWSPRPPDLLRPIDPMAPSRVWCGGYRQPRARGGRNGLRATGMVVRGAPGPRRRCSARDRALGGPRVAPRDRGGRGGVRSVDERRRHRLRRRIRRFSHSISSRTVKRPTPPIVSPSRARDRCCGLSEREVDRKRQRGWLGDRDGSEGAVPAPLAAATV